MPGGGQRFNVGVDQSDAASLLHQRLESFDEVPVTFFLTGRENTLPMYIYSSLRQGPSPEINAISTVIFVGTVALIGVSIVLLSRDKGQSS